jgi:hypothetical protein
MKHTKQKTYIWGIGINARYIVRADNYEQAADRLLTEIGSDKFDACIRMGNFEEMSTRMGNTRYYETSMDREEPEEITIYIYPHCA